MKILYITGLWSGLHDLLLDGVVESRGMPAFIHPLRMLLDRGHQVDLLIASSLRDPHINISAQWMKRCRVNFVYWNSTGIQGMLSTLRLYRVASATLVESKYDLVYCHGAIGVIGNLAANRHRIPVAQRLYGSFLHEKLKTLSPLRIFFRHPLEVLSFRVPKAFLLVTNDGTHADKVFGRLGDSKAFKFYFRLNGVEPVASILDSRESWPKSTAASMFYPARVVKWKRQHLAIELLAELSRRGHRLHLYFAGHIGDLQYEAKLRSLMRQYGLTNQVFFCGTLPRQSMREYYRRTICTLSFYEVSNLGNVAIETMRCGGVLIACNDATLNDIVEHEVNGFLVDDVEDAANRVESLLSAEMRVEKMRVAAQARAQRVFETWQERAAWEARLLEELA